jgi:hypothetical protein
MAGNVKYLSSLEPIAAGVSLAGAGATLHPERKPSGSNAAALFRNGEIPASEAMLGG